MASLILNHSIDVWLSDPVIRHFVTAIMENSRFLSPLADQDAVEANESAVVVLRQTEVTRVLRETFGHYWRLGDNGSERVVWSSSPEEQAYVSGLLYTAFPDVDRFCTELDRSQMVEAYPFLFEKDLVYLENKSRVLYAIQYRLHDKWVDRHTGEWYLDIDLPRVYRDFAEEFGLKVPEAAACS
jgi:hypothetical protein